MSWESCLDTQSCVLRAVFDGLISYLILLYKQRLLDGSLHILDLAPSFPILYVTKKVVQSVSRECRASDRQHGGRSAGPSSSRSPFALLLLRHLRMDSMARNPLRHRGSARSRAPIKGSNMRGQHAEDKPTRSVSVRNRQSQLLNTNINIAASTFKAQLWLQVSGMVLPRPDFPTEEIKFPIGPDGKLTFRPSAGWFLDKLEFCKVEGVVKLLDKLIRVEGEDVYIAARWEGMFFERFELHDFPFDLQCLTMSLSINCRTTGPIPTNWAVSSETSTFVSSDEQLLGDAWRLKLRSMLLRTHLVGVDADRLFPTISISAVIQRQSHYFVTNGVIHLLSSVF